ncbi:putative histone deacetylase HOS3 [Rosellinia necatrix]|uniref:Putative histone deacetylase HOS3 n=1 Tax=Rosellinia necatrix TaxID=77044 RepID=A0A1S8A639_ROSNE|nr:putative histone deacetylase HOS3 [Rosellinia necatrix]
MAGSSNRLGDSDKGEPNPTDAFGFSYDPNWWSIAELDSFDAAKVTPLPEPKKPRTITPGNYSSPTQSSNAKMTETAKMRRSWSGLPGPQQSIPRSPTPPPPDIPWTTAAHELGKLLIPSNRQIDSCTHAELNAEAAKAKKDRQSLQTTASEASDTQPTAPTTAPTRMSLRERKPVSYLEDDDNQSRRKTVAGPAVLAASKGSSRGPQSETKQPRPANRRLSTASSLSTVGDARFPAGPTARPNTSLSARPTSSMSVRTQASTSINVRKTRPAAPKKASGRPRGSRKTEPATVKAEAEAPAITTPTLPSVTNENGMPPPHNQATVAVDEISPTAATSPKDLDQITNAMRKIKINVLTKEQKAARQKAKIETAAVNNELMPKEENHLNEQPPSLSPVAVAQPHLISSDMGSIQDPSTPVGLEPRFRGDRTTPTESRLETMIPMTPTIISPTEPSPSSTPFASSPLVAPPVEPTQDADLFIPYQPDGPPPSAIPIRKPIQILEPNTGTPAGPASIQQSRLQSYSVPVSPARRGGHGFTATSNIPFSPAPVPSGRPISIDIIPILPRPSNRLEDADLDAPDTPKQQ